MRSLPFHVIAGQKLGKSRSSLTAVGQLNDVVTVGRVKPQYLCQKSVQLQGTRNTAGRAQLLLYYIRLLNFVGAIRI